MAKLLKQRVRAPEPDAVEDPFQAEFQARARQMFRELEIHLPTPTEVPREQLQHTLDAFEQEGGE